MPRCTNAQYLYQRERLRANWIDQHARAFSRLESQEQMDLHDYFAPTEPIDDEAALRHRSEVTKSFPSLPQKAGRAYQSALPFLDAPSPEPARPIANRAARRHPVKQGSRRVVIHAVRNPKVDTHKLSRALIAIMDARPKEQRDKDDTAA
ncbi:MAG: hypothetical protein QOH69_2605 [Actinomycetota bacterium]|jgi:hypothetical protein|nr:hypothetical protein [Actinomycetota bacterium]